MGRFSPAERVSDLLSHMADELRKDEGATSGPIPFEVLTNPATQTEASAMQRFVERMTSPIPYSTGDPTSNSDNRGFEEAEDDTEAKTDARDNSRVEGKLSEEGEELEEGEDEEVKGNVVVEAEDQRGGTDEKTGKVVMLEEDRSEFDVETLDERAMRRILITARREETVEVEGKFVESATKEVEEFQTAERKRKGKQVATPSKKRKPRQASKSVVIQEPITDLTREPYYQEEGNVVKDMETS